MATLEFRGETLAGAKRIEADLGTLVIAGWTGRDAEALEAHIAELEKLGVKRPATTPIFYRVAASLLTTSGQIEVAGPDTSGEVEPVVVSLESGGLWVGVGSDHTDRKAEAVSVAMAKQLCAKPLAPVLWRFAEVAAHWDQLILRSFATRQGRRRLYQEGPVAALRPPPELVAKYMKGKGDLPSGTVMFGGTLAVHGAIEGAELFEIELEDPVLRRTIAHRYRTDALSLAE